jgi:3-methyladenine DNA glycosylase Tag
MPEDRMSHRAPWECTFAKEQRSRCLPGKKPRTDHKYFEALSLCILQAGLSWASVRRSWPRYRSAFLDFEIAKLAHATPAALLRSRAR